MTNNINTNNQIKIKIFKNSIDNYGFQWYYKTIKNERKFKESRGTDHQERKF